MVEPDDVLTYWFGTPATTFDELRAQMQRWFRGGPEMDREVVARFGATVDDAIAGRLEAWLTHPKGWLALVIVLDQLTRNALRDQPRMYQGDPRAQALAVDALDSGKTRGLAIAERHFSIMPLLHSESLAHQERGVVEMEKIVEAAPASLRPFYAGGVEQANKYRDVIRRFGRFPHRNAILGRTSTPEELAFLRDWAEKASPAVARQFIDKR